MFNISDILFGFFFGFGYGGGARGEGSRGGGALGGVGCFIGWGSCTLIEQKCFKFWNLTFI